MSNNSQPIGKMLAVTDRHGEVKDTQDIFNGIHDALTRDVREGPIVAAIDLQIKIIEEVSDLHFFSA